MRDFNQVYKRWIEKKDLDGDLMQDLRGLKDENEIRDRFYKDLEFGTGGLRGILGAGTSRMNIYTVRKATQGLSDYVNHYYRLNGLKSNGSVPSVAIGYDSRINSRLFAFEAAKVLAANNIKVYLYPELIPTPALSFAVRYYHCCAGIMVTASHNPAQYNGYKVYNEEGCQLTLDAASELLALIEKLDIFDDIKTIPDDTKNFSDDIKQLKLVENIPVKVTDAFLTAVYSERMGQTGCEKLSVVYSPLNGTGNKPVRAILEMIGVKEIHIVEQQELPDGNFTTCPDPNPEKREALTLGLELCEELYKKGRAPDLMLATDPDCDRVGIAVRNKGEYNLISGNEVGVLLLDFICQKRMEESALNPMPKEPIVIKTIVSSKMAEKVANHYGVHIIDVLTGFKFIGEQIGFLERKGEDDRFIFGFEESYGYLSGSYVRDKDAVNASMLICEMTAYYKQKGITLIERLEELYHQFGYYKNDLIDFNFNGSAGMEKMKTIMTSLRSEPPKSIIGKKVTEIADYNLSKRRITGNTKACDLAAGYRPINLPKSEVLEYILENGSSIIVRPSGTEPKLKIYLSTKGNNKEDAAETIEQLKKELAEVIMMNRKES